MGEKGNNPPKSSGFMLLLRTLKHVIRRDENYIQKVSAFDEKADTIQIRHNGDEDYGKIIYVIKENSGVDGFCATVGFVLCRLIYATQHGFAPVIRLTKEFAYYDEEMSREIANPWEYYFVKSDDYDENRALHVCYSNYYHMNEIREKYHYGAYDEENYHDVKLFNVCSPIIREYMVLKPSVVKEASDLLKPIKEKGGKVLGVHFRGTDYKKGYNRHPVYVDEDQTIEEIRKAMDTGKFEAVFLATDDAEACDRIRKALPDTLILIHENVYRSDGDESVAFSTGNRKNHRYLLGLEIARDMYTLSLCDGLVAGKSSVGFLSNLYKHSRNEEYEYLHIIDNGNYSNDNEYYKES